MEAFNKQKLGRLTVGDFYFDISKLSKKLKKSQLDLITKCIDGLPHRLQFFVRAGRSTNIDDALLSARVGESVGYGTGNGANNHTTETSLPHSCNAASVPARDLQDHINNLAAQVMSLTVMLKQSTSTPIQHRSGADNRESCICFKCQGPGHRRNVCK